jgi:predicted peptidase
MLKTKLSAMFALLILSGGYLSACSRPLPTPTVTPTLIPTPMPTLAPTTIPTLESATEEKKGVFLKKTFVSENGGSIPYQFLIPENSSQDQSYPLLVFLHGAGELGSDNSSQLAGFPSYLVSGQNKSEIMFWQHPDG